MILSVANRQFLKRLISRYLSSFFTADKKLSIILNYHSIHPTHHSSTRPHDFEQQMTYLKSEFTVISLSEFQTLRETNVSLPDKLAVITFDDGYEDNFQYAFPILKKMGLPATIFISTGFVDGDVDITQRYFTYRGLRPLTWDQIRDMQKNGISFGCHTDTHQILAEISVLEGNKEISLSKDKLEKQICDPVVHFAYPLGQPHTFNAGVKELLKENGFLLSCATIWGSDNSDTDMFALQRIRIDTVDSMTDFIDKVHGKWDFIYYIQTMKERWALQ